jgi:ketosteroid isomerase-like protein
MCSLPPIRRGKKAVTEKGRFVTVFRKEADGSWKAVQQINNAEAPATSK